MDRFLEIKNLEKLYFGRRLFGRRQSAVRAVDGVSLSIDRNTVFGLVGESGCGKTSLARAVLYLDPPTAGEVRLNGVLLGGLSHSELRSQRMRMQIVFQDPNSALKSWHQRPGKSNTNRKYAGSRWHSAGPSLALSP